MIGKTQIEDLKESAVEEQQITAILEKELQIVLTGEGFPKHLGDRKNTVTGKMYEFKKQNYKKYAVGLLFELFAGMQDKEFEKGWAYRYEQLDYLVTYNDVVICIFDWQRLRKFFWEHWTEWNFKIGVKNNPYAGVVWMPEALAEQFVVKTIRR